MNVLRNKILQIRKDTGLSWEAWAEQSSRSVETLKKQMADDSNPTLSTLTGILAPLHATLDVVTEADIEQYAQAEILRDRVQALEKLLDDARHDRDILDRQISDLTKSNEKMAVQMEQQQRIIAKMEQRIEQKEDAICRKDAAIADLLRKSGVLT